MDKVKVGIIGFGFMGANHLRVYTELKECEVVGVVDNSSEVLNRVKNSFNVKTYNNVEELLKDGVDAVTVSVPTRFHHEVASKIIDAGVDVLIEKPITDDVSKAEELVKFAKKKNVKLMVGHIERFNPMVQRVKEILNSISMDEIYFCASYRLNPGLRTSDSAIIDLSTHDIDVFRYLLKSEVKDIDANAVFEDGVEKHVVATLYFSNGITTTINSSLLYPMKKRELVILGKKLLIEGNYMSQDISIYRRKTIEDSPHLGKIEYEIIKPLIKNAEPLKLELKHFLDCIINNKEPLVTGEEGKKTLEVATRIKDICRKKLS
jgi:UDP-N-acetylglucosamine 3-dehydrogenase